jgi:hypothetical protein
VGDHARLGIVMRLDLQQVVAAAARIKRCTPMQHQAFAARAHGGFHQLAQRGVTRYLVLRHRLHPWLADGRHRCIEGRDAVGEGAAMRRQVKYHEADLTPGSLIGLLLAHGGQGLLEPATPTPEFTVQRCLGPPAGEPRRRDNALTTRA